MIRKHVSLILLMLCLCAFVCNDNPIDIITPPPDTEGLTGGLTGSSTNIDRLRAIVPNITAPNIAGEVTDLTPEVWEKIKFAREWSYLRAVEFRDRGIEIEPWRAEDEEYMARRQEIIDKTYAKVKFLEVEQPKFYNRYIDADGVSIIGNEKTLDEYFVMARDIFLIMTSKNPRLREPLRDHFYMVITGGFEEYWLTDRGHQSSPQLIPNHRYTSSIVGFIWWANTCVTGGISLTHAPRTASGLAPVHGWCVSHVISRYDDLINPTKGAPSAHSQPFLTFIHEMVHALERIMINIDPTFEDRYTAAYEAYLASDPIYPTSLGEWWAGETPYWFLRSHPDYIYHDGVAIYTAQDWMDRSPEITELFLQWYPDVSLTGIAKYYFGRENY